MKKKPKLVIASVLFEVEKRLSFGIKTLGVSKKFMSMFLASLDQ